MSLKIRRAREWLAKRQRQPKRDYPAATMVYYGPTKAVATKLVSAIIYGEDEAPGELETWFADEGDIRDDAGLIEEVVSWMKSCEVQRVVTIDGLMGCPHEEGIDYPEGENCPRCPDWADPDRVTGELTDEIPNDEGMHDPDDVTLIYSPHCQVVTHEGVDLDVQIYTGAEPGWLLEVVNERGTSIVWDDLFETDDEAFAAFKRTLDEEGLAAFADQ